MVKGIDKLPGLKRAIDEEEYDVDTHSVEEIDEAPKRENRLKDIFRPSKP